MNSTPTLIILSALCWMSMQLTSGQILNPHDTDRRPTHPGNNNHLNNHASDPNHDEDDVMYRMAQVETIHDFMNLMQRNGRPITESDIYEDERDEDGKQVISGGGRLAMPDRCEPRNTTITIDIENTDSDTAYFPRCTRIERCGGCCPSPNLECVPVYTEGVRLKVLKGRFPYPGASHLEYTGFAPVIVYRHTSCRVQCTLNAEKCGTKKDFLRRECVCRCKNMVPCAAPTVWDPEACSCKCPQVTNCCENGNACGMVFNHNLCECVLNNDGRMSISADSSNRNSNSNRAQSRISRPRPTPTTTTTTTTTTTPAPTTPADPCANHRCPPSFTKVVRGSACQCRPSRRFGRRRGGRRG